MIDTEHFENKLKQRKLELLEMIREIKDQLDDPKAASFSEQAVEREGDEVLELREKVELEELAAIDAALSRLKSGVYGTCLKCENEISVERLEAVPYAIYCRNCMK